MASVARGHKLNEHHFSETTKIYIDKDIDAISYMVFSSNVFSGIKYEFLGLIDEKFEDRNLREKHIKSVEFGMDNYEIEIMMESISSQRNAITKFFEKYLYTKEKKKGTLFELIFGKDCTSKHEDAKCLLRAYLNSENKHEINLSEGFTKPCIYTGANSCIGCPYLIAEKYFLYELELRLMDAIESLESATSDFDKMIHLGRLKDLFFPIVFDAVNEFGADYVKGIVSFDKMTSVYKRERDALNLREKEGKMKVISN